MENHYYISYSDVSHNTENYPNDIRLRKISGYEKAINYLETEYTVLEEWSFKSNKWNDPLLISNDQKLQKKYRNVFSESEFRAFCVESAKNQNELKSLPLNEQFIAINSSLSINGNETFNHFLKIKDGIYKEAYMFRKFHNRWTDEETGASYDYDEESGWRTNDWVDIDDEFITPL